MESYNEMALSIVDYLDLNGERTFANYLLSSERTIIQRPPAKSTILYPELYAKYTAYIKKIPFSTLLREIKSDSTISLDRIVLTFSNFFLGLLKEVDFRKEQERVKYELNCRQLIFNRLDKQVKIDKGLKNINDVKFSDIKTLEKTITDEKKLKTYLQAASNFERNYKKALNLVEINWGNVGKKLAKGYLNVIQQDRKTYLPPAPKEKAPAKFGAR